MDKREKSVFRTMRDALVAAEWGGKAHIDKKWEPACPVCGQCSDEPHDIECLIDIALELCEGRPHDKENAKMRLSTEERKKMTEKLAGSGFTLVEYTGGKHIEIE